MGDLGYNHAVAGSGQGFSTVRRIGAVASGRMLRAFSTKRRRTGKSWEKTEMRGAGEAWSVER